MGAQGQNPSAQSNPQSDERYCTECGAVISTEAEFCPECGARTAGLKDPAREKSRIGETGYKTIGAITGIISFVFLPIVFGPITIFIGVQLYRKHSELAGIAMMIFGGAGLVIGAILGVLVMT